MKVGYTAMFQNPENQISDRKLYQEELRMAVRAESLGFDSRLGYRAPLYGLHPLPPRTAVPDVRRRED